MGNTDTVTRKGFEEFPQVDELKRELQSIADSSQMVSRFQVRDAALSMIAAINYDDDTLIDSCLHSLWTALADVARDAIVKDLEASKALKRAILQGWEKYINKKAYDISVFEELKDLIESVIDERIQSMTKGRKLASSLERAGHPVENARAIDDGIRDLRRFRDEFFKNWPERKFPAPLDRAAIANAREAIRRGEKGLRKGDLAHGSNH